MRSLKYVVLALAFSATVAQGGTPTQFPAPNGATSDVLTIRSATDLFAMKPLVNAFQARNPGVIVSYEDLQTNALYADSLASCRGRRDAADLVISSSIDQQIKLVNDGCARPLAVGAVARLPDWARWRDEVFGLTFEPAVIVYNKKLVPAADVPQTRFDLVDVLRSRTETYRGKVGTYDIETSGVGYLFAFEDARQASTFGRLIESLGRAGVRLFCCTSEILDRIATGELLIGYNVLGSYAIARAKLDPDIGIVLPSDYTLVMSRAAYMPRDAARPDLARRFLDFLLSEEGRRIVTEESMLFSALDGASGLRQVPQLAGSQPLLRPIALTPALIVGLDQQKRALFLKQWRDSVNVQFPTRMR